MHDRPCSRSDGESFLEENTSVPQYFYQINSRAWHDLALVMSAHGKTFFAMRLLTAQGWRMEETDFRVVSWTFFVGKEQMKQMKSVIFSKILNTI
jgi:hypothetical protein